MPHLFDPLRLRDLSRFAVPGGALRSLVVVNLLTYGVLAIEVALGILVWNRRLRPWVLGLGIALHVGIELTVMVGFFSLAIVAAYIAWVPPDVMDRLLGAYARRGAHARPEVVEEGEAVTPSP